MRAPAIQQVVESLQAGRSGPRDALQVVKLGDARQFRFDGVVRGPVRRAALGERHGDVNVIGDKRLLLARLARRHIRAACPLRRVRRWRFARQTQIHG